jgi:uncharacterized protein (DUF2147 family)
MRNFVRDVSLTLLVAVAASSTALAADPTGLWLRENGKGTVRIAACGAALCGTVASVKDPDSAAKVGQRVFYGMVPAGENSWSGHAFNPEDGKTYSGTMTLAGNHLTTAGCVLGGWICKTVGWSRMK